MRVTEGAKTKMRALLAIYISVAAVAVLLAYSVWTCLDGTIAGDGRTDAMLILSLSLMLAVGLASIFLIHYAFAKAKMTDSIEKDIKS